MTETCFFEELPLDEMRKKTSFFRTLCSFVLQNYTGMSRNKSREKRYKISKKSDIPGWFLFFKQFQYTGEILKNKLKKLKKLSFSTFFLFTADVFSRHTGVILQNKNEKRSEKWSFSPHLGAVLRKNKSRSVTIKLIYLPKKWKTIVKKTRFFHFCFEKKTY